MKTYKTFNVYWLENTDPDHDIRAACQKTWNDRGDYLKAELDSLKHRLELSEKVVEAARESVKTRYDALADIDARRALIKIIANYDQHNSKPGGSH